MSASTSVRTKHLFAKPPTDAELSTLLPAPRADLLSYCARDDIYEVAVAPRSIWFLLPGLVWFCVVVAVAPWLAPLWGGQFMGWARWGALMLLTWVVLLPAALVLISWLVQRSRAGENVAVIDPVSGKLYLPSVDRAVAAEKMHKLVEVTRWAKDRGRWCPLVQTSVLVEASNGKYELVPIVTQVRPARLAMPLVDRLSTVFGVSVLRVKLDEHESRNTKY